MSTKRQLSLAEYYRNEDVRARLVEFLGGDTLDTATAEYITADGTSADVQFTSRPTSQLWRCLNESCEVGRSLWDRESLILDLDVEYVNFDQPALPFVQPKLAYQLQQPTVVAIQQWLLRLGIAPLHWISGQGHHLVWRIRQDSVAFDQLVDIGHLNHSLQQRYEQASQPNRQPVGWRLGKAFAGAGMLMEFLVAEIIGNCKHATEIPLVMTAIEAGPVRKTPVRNREVIAFDISEYGDPLDTRGVRMPFSVYLKPDQKRYQLGDSFVDAMPTIIPIPLFEMETTRALEVMRDAGDVAVLASRASIAIPEFSGQTEELVARYRNSPLAVFHRDYYRDHHDVPDRWTQTYDRTDLESLPRCVQIPLEQPNDLLLKPAVLQLVTRTLMAHGWSPRHIAGLIRSKYERDFQWGRRWYRYDAASRADFYVRMFAGQIVTGQDELIDFNCMSTQEKRFCPVSHCGSNLVDLRNRLLERVRV